MFQQFTHLSAENQGSVVLMWGLILSRFGMYFLAEHHYVLFYLLFAAYGHNYFKAGKYSEVNNKLANLYDKRGPIFFIYFS